MKIVPVNCRCWFMISNLALDRVRHSKINECSQVAVMITVYFVCFLLLTWARVLFFFIIIVISISMQILTTSALTHMQNPKTLSFQTFSAGTKDGSLKLSIEFVNSIKVFRVAIKIVIVYLQLQMKAHRFCLRAAYQIQKMVVKTRSVFPSVHFSCGQSSAVR